MNLEAGLPSCSIMLVDDTPENLRVLEGMLRNKGYRLLEFPRGDLALKAAEKNPPDLVLLDINMPGMDGYAVCKALKASDKTRHIPVIFITALDSVDDKVAAFQVGGVDYITKPFQMDEVLARVALQLEMHRLRRETLRYTAELEDSLQRQKALERDKEALVQMIVHDLKNPLTIIMGNTGVALDDLPQDFAGRSFLERAYNAAAGMHRLVLNILDVMKQDSSSLKLRLEPVLIHEFLDLATAAGRSKARLSGHLISIRCPEEQRRFLIDRSHLTRVIENIIDNAMKYAPAKTEIVVAAAWGEDSSLNLSVADQGPGIPDEHKAQVFELYARLDRDIAQAATSRGLGLAFCKLAIEAHKGSIHIADNVPHGTIFQIVLPQAAVAA